MTTAISDAHVSLDDLHTFCRGVLTMVGTRADHAAITADALVTTDSWSVFTHGTKLLPGYLRRLSAGGIAIAAEPRVEREGPAWALVDGCSALGQVTGEFAMRQAIAKAKQSGISYVGVRNSNHFGAAGYYAVQAARENLIGIALANDTPSVAAPGSRAAVTGTNPISYAIPVAGGDPIFLDIAISTVAGGKVYAAHQRGEPIRDDWLIGPDGRPTTDGSLYPGMASLAPMTGHKGYGLALLVETLSGVMTGAAVTWQVGSWIFGNPAEPTRHGAAFLAIDPQTILPPAEFAARVDALVKEIHSTPTADGVKQVLLPGEREWASRRHALREGLDLPADVARVLEGVAESTGVALPWSDRR